MTDETQRDPIQPSMPQPGHRGAADTIDAAGILEALPVAVYTTDLEGRITFFNQAAAAMAGHRSDDLSAWPKSFGQDPIEPCVTGDRPDGAVVPFTPAATPLFDSSGERVGELNILLGHPGFGESSPGFRVQHDPLTGLPSRNVFSDMLSRYLEAAVETEDHFGVIVIDLDHFKEINDTFGHVTGDDVIRIVANRLQQAAPDCCIARKGGDEFIILVPNVRSPYRLLERIFALQDVAAGDIDVDGHVIRTTFQAGVALFPEHGRNEIELVSHADAALTNAKQDVRGAIHLFDAEMAQRLTTDLTLRRDLQLAIASNQLTLHYQPIADRKRRVAGFEALARWHHPEFGPIAPDKFIPLAETSGLILPLGRWVLETACREASSWHNPLTIAVNLSALQFQHEDIPTLIRATLNNTGLAPERLELEITESVLIGDKERAVVILTALRNIGVKIALDDFGTGYSSLSYLKDFPFSKIKIDRSFVGAIGKKPSAEAIIQSVIGLGHSLDIVITAEGVETEEQLGYLVGESCDNFQGYLIGRPAEIGTMNGFTTAPVERLGDHEVGIIPDHESKRLAALHRLALMDTLPEEDFDRITRLAKATLQVPIALISLIDQDRQWFKSKQGIDIIESERTTSFCTHAIETNRPFVVSNALDDPRFCDNPFVTGDPGIRFYLGIPLTTTDGYNIGTLCVIDDKPRQITSMEIDVMNDMARLVVEMIELRRIATTDSLTGSMTRRGFEARIQKEWNRTNRFKNELSLIALDVDQFKLVNNFYGHAQGDLVLQIVTQAIRRELSDTDFIARLGGDEFVIVLPNTNEVRAFAVAEKMRQRIACTDIDTFSTPIHITASFGVAARELSDRRWQDVLAKADAALYQAKKSGRNICIAPSQKLSA